MLRVRWHLCLPFFAISLLCVSCGGGNVSAPGNSGGGNNGGGNNGGNGGGGGNSPTITGVSISGPSTIHTNVCGKFSATVTGTGSFDSSVQWSVSNIVGGTAANGLIDNMGNYCAPAQVPTANPVSVKATASADSSKSDSEQLQILATNPVISSISPQPATAGDQITITGDNFQAPLTALFSNSAGGTIRTAPVQITGSTSIKVPVPQGTVSGPVYVASPVDTVNPVQSNSVQFQRLARLRIHAIDNDLTAGESTTVQYALLGDATPRTVSFNADLGNFSGVTYNAPSTVNDDTRVHITGCITGTNSCDTRILIIHPLRITPNSSVVSLGQSVQLFAILGGSPAAANWNLDAGGGSVTSSGLYIAGTHNQDGGPALVSATSGGKKVQTSVGVTGSFPGAINRIFEYSDAHDINLPGVFIDGMVAHNNRLYVAASNHLGDYAGRYAWIDIYDISDPVHPLWISAIESNSHAPLFSFGEYLYSYVNTDLAVPGVPYTITLYHLLNGVPIFVAQTQLPPWWGIQASDGLITVVPSSSNASAGFDDIRLYDLRSGSIVQKTLHLPLPGDAGSFLPDAALAFGSRLFLSTERNDLNAGSEILTYDLSSPPPTLSGSIDGQGLSFYASGPLLFAGASGMNVYDISSQIPRKLSSVDEIGAKQLVGSKLLAYSAQQGCRIVDMADPQVPRITASLFDGVIVPGCDSGFLLGNYVYTAEQNGGIVIYDASQPGGPIFKTRLYGGGIAWSNVYDLHLRPPYLYAAAATDIGGTLSVYDTSTDPATSVAQFLDTTQQATALESSGNVLYLGMTNALNVLDISQPTSPLLETGIGIPVVSLARKDNTLFAGTFNNGITVYDIHNPVLPTVVRTITLPDLPVKLHIFGNLLLAADNSGGLFIYDVTLPSAPVAISQISQFKLVEDAAIEGNTLFLAADTDGLVIMDISNPMMPHLVSTTSLSTILPFQVEPSNEALSVTINNGIAYVGTYGDNGIVFGFDYKKLTAPRIVSLYAHGDFILTWVSNLVFSGSDLFVGGSLGYTAPVSQFDISSPRNSINQYFPPAILQKIVPPDFLKTSSKVRVGTDRRISRWEKLRQ